MNTPSKKCLCLAAVALILCDEAGKEYRVPQGEVVELTEAQYQDVSAYVTLVEPDDATAQALNAAVVATPEVAPEVALEAEAQSPLTQVVASPKSGKVTAKTESA